MRQHAAVQTCGSPVLTPAQRRFAVASDIETPAERHILRPASLVLLNWRRARMLKATQWSLISFATGLLAGTFVLTNGMSPLFRFWAGIFLFGSEILAVAGQSIGGQTPGSFEPRGDRERTAALLIGILFILGATRTAASLEGSRWIWLLGVAAGISTIVQCAAFEGAKDQYRLAAGAGARACAERLCWRFHCAGTKPRFGAVKRKN